MNENKSKILITPRELKAISVAELLQFEFKPHEYILEPWLITQSLTAVFRIIIKWSVLASLRLHSIDNTDVQGTNIYIARLPSLDLGLVAQS